MLHMLAHRDNTHPGHLSFRLQRPGTPSGPRGCPPFANTMAISILLCALIALVTAVTVKTFMSWHRLRHIPGPFSASLWRGWMMRHTLAGNMNLELKRVCDEYGTYLAAFGAVLVGRADGIVGC